MNVLWHNISFSGVLWRRRVASGGWAGQAVRAARKFRRLCLRMHLSYSASPRGKAVAISELPQRVQRGCLHCLLLLGFCNLNKSSTAMENTKGTISAYWPPWSINIASSLPAPLLRSCLGTPWGVTAAQHAHLLVTYFGWFFSITSIHRWAV